MPGLMRSRSVFVHFLGYQISNTGVAIIAVGVVRAGGIRCSVHATSFIMIMYMVRLRCAATQGDTLSSLYQGTGSGRGSSEQYPQGLRVAIARQGVIYFEPRGKHETNNYCGH